MIRTELWTSNEVNQLETLLNSFTQEGKWEIIAEDLPWRTSEACKKHWDSLIANASPEQNVIEDLLSSEQVATGNDSESWTPQESRLLARAVRDYKNNIAPKKWEWISLNMEACSATSCQSTNEWPSHKALLLYKMIEEQLKISDTIKWNPISEVLNRSVTQCSSKYWNDKRPISLRVWSPQKINLLKSMVDEQLKTVGSICWKSISEALGPTPLACKTKFSRLEHPHLNNRRGIGRSPESPKMLATAHALLNLSISAAPKPHMVSQWTPQRTLLLHQMVEKQLKTNSTIEWMPIARALNTTFIACKSKYFRDKNSNSLQFGMGILPDNVL